MEPTNLFNDLLERQALLEVGMDEVKVLLPNDEHASIGTQNLNGCTCFVVLGRGPKRGIVMAHAGPTVLPEQVGSSSGESAKEAKERGITRGNKHFMDFFRRVALEVTKYPEYFELPVSCCILASFENEIPLGDLEKLAQAALRSLKIPLKTYTYDVLMPGVFRKPGKGTVVAVRNNSEESEVWVEDERKWPAGDDTGALALLFDKLGLEDGANDRRTAPTYPGTISTRPSVPQRSRSLHQSAPSVATTRQVSQKQRPPMGQRLGNPGSSTSSSAGAGPTAWWFENNKYTWYQGGIARTTHKGVPLHARFYNPTNETVCYTDHPKRKPSSHTISDILTRDVGWRLEGQDYIFYNNEGAVVNRQKVIPTLVGIFDARNNRKILHDGKVLHQVKMQPPAKDDEDDDDDDDGSDDDDDDGSEDDGDDDDEEEGDDGEKGSDKEEGDDEEEEEEEEGDWDFDGKLYVCRIDGLVVKQQPTPPLGVIIFDKIKKRNVKYAPASKPSMIQKPGTSATSVGQGNQSSSGTRWILDKNSGKFRMLEKLANGNFRVAREQGGPPFNQEIWQGNEKFRTADGKTWQKYQNGRWT